MLHRLTKLAFQAWQVGLALKMILCFVSYIARFCCHLWARPVKKPKCTAYKPLYDLYAPLLFKTFWNLVHVYRPQVRTSFILKSDLTNDLCNFLPNCNFLQNVSFNGMIRWHQVFLPFARNTKGRKKRRPEGQQWTKRWMLGFLGNARRADTRTFWSMLNGW